MQDTERHDTQIQDTQDRTNIAGQTYLIKYTLRMQAGKTSGPPIGGAERAIARLSVGKTRAVLVG
jgi:hypothetical protein